MPCKCMHAGEELVTAYPFRRKAEELVRRGFVMQPAPRDWYAYYRGESYEEGVRSMLSPKFYSKGCFRPIMACC